jgi:hypothetical protein
MIFKILRIELKDKYNITDFKLQQVNENDLKSVKNKRGNWKIKINIIQVTIQQILYERMYVCSKIKNMSILIHRFLPLYAYFYI